MKYLRFLLHIFAGLFLLLCSFPGSSQTVRLNEICPSNVSGLLNSNGQYDDWVEIHNPATTPQSVNGWGLSDDPLQPYKFTFPNISLAANQHIVVFAADTNITSVATNWQCAAGSNGWSMYSSSTAPASNWTTPGFNAATWTTKTVPMGYGSNYSSIVTSSGSISGTPLAVALRRTFTLTDTSKITAGAVFVDYDDGYVLYINGVEISRANFVGAGGWNDTNMTSRNANIVNPISTARDPDSIYLSKSQLSQLLVTGTNVISMEVHTRSTNDLYAACYLYFGILDNSYPFTVQSAPSYLQAPTSAYSADFKMSRLGETIYLTDSSGAVVDSYTYGFTDSDNSWGRCGNSSPWNLFATPTPGMTNPSGSFCCTGYTPPPVITPASGFYSGPVSVTCLPSSGTSFTYTTNGDIPQTNSRSFSGPLTVNTTTTIRARAFKAGYLPSRVVTNTYFINTDIQLPIFTITTDSLNLWDWNTGIYVLGPNASSTYPYFGANFWQEWKKPAHIEFFDKQKSKLFDFDAEINIDGNYTQAKPQKSFAISLGDRFGLGSINYNFITDKPFIDNTKDIVLRNMGNDWNKCHLRDPFMERMMKETWSGYVASEPVVMFLNGEFWGVYSFHELDNSTWIKNNFGLKSGEFDYLKESGSVIDSGTAYSGSLFFDIYNYTRTHDPTTTAYYNWINDHIDLQNYADYFICETYVNNDDWIGDWVNNIKMWNPRGPNGKLHYLMYDLDMGFGYGGLSVSQDRLNMARNPTPPAFSYSSEIFDTVLYNPTFRRYFINRYADLMNSEYLRDSLNPILAGYKDSLAPDMPEQFQKWGNDVVYWDSSITAMKNWFYRRTSYVRSHILTNFGLTSQITWTLDVNPPGAGRILVNTIIPPVYPWSGVYFNNNPVTITAIPNPGYTFDHWVSNTLGNTNNNRSVTVNYTQSQLTTAYFTGTPRTPQLYINEINYNSDSALDCGDWVEIYNKGSFAVDLSDWELRDQYNYHRYRIPVGTVIPANGYLVLAEDMDKFGAIHPTVTNVIGPIGFNFSNSGDQIRLLDYRDFPVDSVYYQQFAPWPVLADGGGYTCERLTPPNDPYDGANWFPGCYGGSPGRVFGATFGANMPVSGGNTFCAGDTLTLSVPPLSGALYQWYRNGAVITGATDSVYQTARAGNYYVLLTYQGCSARSDTLTVTQVTQNVAPVASPAYRCGEGVLTLNATASDTVYWFTSSSGGTPIAFGDSLSTPYLLSSTTYYAQAGMNCPSQRTPVVAQILQHAADPVTQDTVSICGPGQVTLTATDTAAIRWYNAEVGGGLLGFGPSLSIPFVPNDTAFFVEAGTYCVSNRLQVYVEVYQAALPTVNSSSRCGDGPLVLMANSSDPLAWYDAAVGGTLVSTASIFITPSLSATTTYYVQSNGNCASSRVPVTATIYPIPPVPVATDDTICQPSSISLTAISPEQVMWYPSPVGGTLLNIGSQYTTPVLNATTTYYVESVSQTCNSARVPVTVTLFQPPVNFLGSDTVVASGTTLLLQADPAASMYIWNTGATTSSISVTCGITNDSTGYYSVTCLYPGGCVASDQIRVDFSTGVENTAVPFVIQGLYPNPVKDVARLVLQARSRTSARIEILDMAGRTLSDVNRSIGRGTNSIEISFAHLAAGCYFIRVSSPDDANILYKVIVE